MSRNHHHSFLVTAAAFHYCLATAAQQWWVASKEAIQDDFFPFFKLVARREAWLDSKKKWLEKFSSSLHPRQQSTLNAERNENHTTGQCLKITKKSLIQNCERSELRLHFEWTKFNLKCQKWSNLASFSKPEACGQTVFSGRSVLIGQKLVENAKIQMRHFE